MRILIVGAGPAGLGAAVNASGDGNEVMIFERHDKVGVKVCGEALPGEALDYVGLKPSNEFVINEVNGFTISFKGEFIRGVNFKNSPYAPGYIIDKPNLLSILLSNAEANGAKVFFNSTVREVDPKSGKIRLKSGEILQGDLIICADGSMSLARKHLDYSNLEIAPCIQYKCSLPANELDSDYLHLDIIGDGYAWVFFKGDDYANVGVGSLNPGSFDAFSYLTKFIKKHRGRIVGKPRGAPVSLGGPIKNFNMGKLVVAGEAAGCVMPLTGEGNRFGIYGGSVSYKPDYRNEFMQKYGNRLETSRKILEFIKILNDEERIEFLKGIEDPLRVLEGNLPSLRSLVSKPGLPLKLVWKYLSS
jgi:digeranylgeranylglycerophospholipid reductase